MSNVIHVLVVEDEASLRGDLEDYLTAKGYQVTGTSTLAESRAILENLPLAENTPLDMSQSGIEGEITPSPRFDAVILDIGLPDGDGSQLLELIQQRLPACGTVILTAYGEPESRIRCLESGADAYLVKRATLREIDATLRSVLRRVGASVSVDSPLVNEWTLNRRDWLIMAPNGLTARLTSTEVALLTTLAENKGSVCHREQLAQSLGRVQRPVDDRNLDAVVRRLRRKIAAATGTDVPIKVVYGIGYTFPAQLRCIN